jgi:deoxyribose-phosphate aldolase
VKKRAGEYTSRRVVKKDVQAAWQLRALTCIDLTTLAGDDTQSNVQRLCFKAANPLRPDLLKDIGFTEKSKQVQSFSVLIGL